MKDSLNQHISQGLETGLAISTTMHYHISPNNMSEDFQDFEADQNAKLGGL